MEKIRAVAVVGPTASGKTGLAVEICKRFYGEAVSADSMQIYSGMDIATAKPTIEEMQNIPHHMMGFLSPDDSFSVAEYQNLAGKCISEIHSRAKLPVIVGGTGLYIDTLLNNTKLVDDSTNVEIRQNLNDIALTQGSDILLKRLSEIDSEYSAKLHPNNTKKIIRALELWQTTGKTMTQQLEESHRNSPYQACFIGLDATDRQFLYDRINKRVDIMIENGLLEEAEKYIFAHKESTSSQAIGYKELRAYFNNEMPLDDAIENLKMATRRYAKRQLTWFRRNKCINWIMIDKYQNKEDLYNEAFSIVENFLKGE